jgi:hypothetical protein
MSIVIGSVCWFSSSCFDSSKQLTREEIVLNGDIVIVKFEWSKTIKFGKRVIQTPLVSIPGSPLCPVTAFKHMCEMLPASEHSPALYSETNNLSFKENSK